MARQRSSVKVNQFIGGLNTEANPINYPLGSTIDEENCDLLPDGSRRRRNGFDAGLGTPVDTGVEYPGPNLGRNQFLWKDAGGIPGKDLLVIQIGSFIGIHGLDRQDLSNNLLFSFTVGGSSNSQKFDFTSVDGILVVATGLPDVWRVEFDGSDFSTSQGRLKIRDLFGVEEPGYTEPQNVATRPPLNPQTDAHVYNLRNQTFGRTIVDGNPSNNHYSTIDPIRQSVSVGNFQPSNADNLNLFRIPDPEAQNNRTVERFDARSMGSNSPSNMRAPMGMFIIDALQRGQGRQQEFAKLAARFGQFQWRPTVRLPADRTPKGASVVGQYAGRVWFAGFSGEVVDGDGDSPRLSSYVMFSQVVKDPSQIFNCFQFADPTSPEDPDLVATDGGFIKIDEAYGIEALVSVETSLFVFAKNGLWRISGEDNNTFSATSYSVARLSNEGCVSGSSIVNIQGTLFYFGENAIFVVSKNQLGDWEVADATAESIQTFYQHLSEYEKGNSFGYYDDEDKAIRWMYAEPLDVRTEFRELVLSTKFNVFTKNRVKLIEGNLGPLSVSGGSLSEIQEEAVTVSGVVVTVNGDIVTAPASYQSRAPSKNFYCNVVQTSPTVRYLLGGYLNEETPYDWPSLSPVDTPAFLTTGFSTVGDVRLRKDIPYLSVLLKVEDGTSCYFQTRWDWFTNPQSGKWTAPRQLYRDILIRPGKDLITTRSRIRGGGQSLAFHLESEEGKPFHIYGWEHNLEITTDE